MSDIQIAGFELIEKIGQGGMGSVWKARQVSLDRIVAIKILPSGLAEDTEEVKRFYSEAKSAAKLKHPGIIAVYDVGTSNGLNYIVMEYVAGYTVREWMKSRAKRLEKDVLEIADSVSEALGYAWDKERIIHFDIKPDNVMVDADGTVKVADLGLARSINAMTGVQEESQILGTPAYMSPEVVQGKPDLDCRADIYSLGASLYELSTGKYPFQGIPAEQVAEMQINDTIEDPTALNPKLSKGFVWFLEKLMAKDRAKRHQNWAAVRSDIARLRKGVIVAPLVPEGASTVRRARLRVTSPTTGRLSPTTGRYSPTTAAPSKKSPVLPMILGVGLLLALLAGVVWFFTAGPESAGRAPQQPPPPGPVRRPEASPQPAAMSEADAEAMFETASQWALDNPRQYDGAIIRFKDVSSRASGTRYAGMADAKLSELYKARDQAVRDVLADLKEQTSGMIQKRQYAEAIDVYEEYDGALAAATKDIRMSLARELRAEKERFEGERPRKTGTTETPAGQVPPAGDDTERRFAALMDDVAGKLISQGVEQARLELARGIEAPELSARSGELQKVRDLLDAAAAIDDRIMDSFREQKGQHVTLRMNSGQVNFVVGEVKSGKVSGHQMKSAGGQTTPSPMTFGLEELSLSEKVSRMPSDNSPEIALVKGLMACSAKAYPQAKTYLSKTHPILADRLIKRLSKSGGD